MDRNPPAAACKLTGIHHVGLTVSDIEASIRFYRDLLGLTLIRRREADADYIGRQTGYPGGVCAANDALNRDNCPGARFINPYDSAI